MIGNCDTVVVANNYSPLQFTNKKIKKQTEHFLLAVFCLLLLRDAENKFSMTKKYTYLTIPIIDNIQRQQYIRALLIKYTNYN